MPNLSYANHLGESIDLTRYWHLQDGTDLNDWTVSHRTLNGRTVGFYRESGTKKLPIVMTAPTAQAGLALRNQLFAIANADIEAAQPGRLHYDGWYLECYVIESAKSLYQYHGGVCSYEMTLLVDEPLWHRDTLYPYVAREDEGAGGTDMPHDFAFDLGATAISDHVVNESSTDADLVVTFHGPCANPMVTIGGNEYGVSASIGDGERVTIDTSKRTITRYSAYGVASDCFGAYVGSLVKGSGRYPFEKLPMGTHDVRWAGSFNIDVTVCERSAERRW